MLGEVGRAVAGVLVLRTAVVSAALMACTRCGKPAVPGIFRRWRHAALADAIACTVPHGPMNAAPAIVPAVGAGPAPFAQASLFDAEAI